MNSMDEMVIISVDDHAVEPPEAFVRHYPEGKKDRAPRIVEEDGKDIWLWNGKRYPTIGLNAVVGRPRSEYGMEPSQFSQLREGGYVPFGPFLALAGLTAMIFGPSSILAAIGL